MNRYEILCNVNGTPEKQKNQLVEIILQAFENPGNWPMQDSERIDLLRRLYQVSRDIRDTEQARQ